MKKLRVGLLVILMTLLIVGSSFADGIMIQSRGAKKGVNDDITSMTGLDNDGIPLAKVANAASDGANADITSLAALSGAQSIPTINLTGGQIAFPATAVPIADANTLDDYEEGTFTPTILLGGTAVTSYYYQNGWYSIIGNRFFFQLRVTVNVIGAGTGAVTIGGLPVNSQNTAGNIPSITVYADYLTGMAGQHLSGRIAPNTSLILLYYQNNTRATALPHTVMDAADTTFILSGNYLI